MVNVWTMTRSQRARIARRIMDLRAERHALSVALDREIEDYRDLEADRDRLRLLTRGACGVCWTKSWAPCEEGTADAVEDEPTGGWMVCTHCQLVDRVHALEQERESILGRVP